MLCCHLITKIGNSLGVRGIKICAHGIGCAGCPDVSLRRVRIGIGYFGSHQAVFSMNDTLGVQRLHGPQSLWVPLGSVVASLFIDAIPTLAAFPIAATVAVVVAVAIFATVTVIVFVICVVGDDVEFNSFPNKSEMAEKKIEEKMAIKSI